MRAQFEEKSYENYFNNELDRRSEVYFPLGQVQEGGLGFDATAFSRNRRLWRRLGHPFWFFPPFRGLELTEIAREMEDYLNIELDHVPTMKSNLLFQYKRPEYITTSLGTEWAHWNEPYFRYNIYQEQQDLLMHIHNTFSSRVLVIYAAPAIQDVNELVKIHLDRQLIDHSNFKKAVDLNGHHRNTYVRAGTYSIAFSEPEKIENLDLLKMIETVSTEDIKENQTNREFVLNFTGQLTGMMYEHSYLADSFRKLNETVAKVQQYKLFHSFLTMSNFRQLTGTQWIIKI